MDLSTLSKAQLTALVKADPKLAKQLLDALEQKAPPAEKPYMLGLHPMQRAFVRDKSKRKALLCPRRAGKTEAACAWLLEGAEQTPTHTSVFIALSRHAGRQSAWNTFQRLDREHGLKLQFKERDNQLKILCPNGHWIWIAGCKDSAEIDKFRGTMYKRVFIDEGASYGDFLTSLIEDALDPALWDLGGEMALGGTPGVRPVGYFYEATTGEGDMPQWPTYSWSTLQNPYMVPVVVGMEERAVTIAAEVEKANAQGPSYINQHAKAWLDEKMKKNGWDENHPTYQREYLGKWVRDEGALVYPYDGMKNAFHQLPEGGKWYYGLGIDCGYEDSSAFVVAAYRKDHPEVYIVHAEKKKHMIPSAMAAHVARLEQTYKFSRKVIDAGGLGKGYQTEMTNRHGLFCEPAKKNNKRAYIEIMRGELLCGNIKVHPGHASCLLDEWERLPWDEDHEEPDDRFEDHASDAALYICRDLISRYRPDIEHKALSAEEASRQASSAAKLKLQRQMQEQFMKRNHIKSVLRRIADGH